MKIKSMSLGHLGTNCYIVHERGEALIIDPGGESEKVISFLNAAELTPKAILLTHAHFDHIGGVEVLRSYYQIDVYIHELEANWLTDPKRNGSALFTGTPIVTMQAEQIITLGKIQIASFSFDAIHTPGHSPGSVSFIFHDELFIISGDVLFHHGIGRTDLLGGDMKQLEGSIKNYLYQLPPSFTVYPGHGPETTIGEEKQYNPFFTKK